MRVTTNTLAGPVQIALEGPGITTHSQSTWTKSSGRVSVNYVLGVSGGRIGQFYPGALP